MEINTIDFDSIIRHPAHINFNYNFLFIYNNK